MTTSASTRAMRVASGRTNRLRALADEYGIGAALLVVAMFVPIYMLFQLQYASPTMSHDYWSVALQSIRADGGLYWKTLFMPSNEHIIALPRLLYWWNMQYFGGSNTVLAVFCWSVVVIQVILMSFMLPLRCREEFPARVGLLSAIFVLSFTPAAIHNFIWSYSGAAWLTANCLTVAALVAALRWSPFGAVALAIVASFTYSTGLMSWFALAAAAWWTVGRRWTVVYLLAGLAGVAVHLRIVPTPVHHAGPILDPLLVGYSFAVTAGSVLSWDSHLAAILGVAAVVLLLCLVYKELQQTSPGGAFWIAIAVYSFLCLLQITVGRAGSGAFDNAMQVSRYATLPALLWTSIVSLSIARFGITKPLGITLAVALVVSTLSAVPTIKAYRQQAMEADVLGIGIRVGRLDNPDRPVTLHYGTRLFAAGPELYRAMETTGHYPFNRHFQYDAGLLGQTIPAAAIRKASGAVSGYVDVIQPASDGLMILSGWAASTNEIIEHVLLTDSSYRVIGAARLGFSRPDVNESLAIPGVPLGWQGIARQLVVPDDYHALVRVKGHQEFYLLKRPAPAPGA